MPVLTLPAGESLRALAARLGVTPEELAQHVGLSDLDQPLTHERRVTVPKGFLKPRPAKANPLQPSARQAGMNTWLALDIEHKRTRAAGGMHAHGERQDENDALDEAQRAYVRFDADSNELAIELYHRATSTPNVGVRARAFAGQGMALAQRHLLYGEPPARARPQALSAAKAALTADPKLGDAHLAMALALEVAATPANLSEAREELLLAVRTDPEAAWCWAELALVCHALADFPASDAAAQRALALAPDWLFSRIAAARCAWRKGEHATSLGHLQHAVGLYPTAAHPLALTAQLLKHLGRPAEAQSALSQAMALATRLSHRELLAASVDSTPHSA